MHPTSRFLCVLSLIFLTVVSIQAQPPGQNSSPPLEVTMILQQQQVRFAAPSSVQELRLEVFDRAGELIHDSGVVNGAELIWPLRKADGQPVASGLYAYQLTLKEASAESPRTQRGHLIVERGQDRDPRVDRVWITSQSPGGVGASITDAELTVAASKEATVAGARISDGRADGSGKGVVALAPNAPTAVVNGAGTPGRIAKWTASDTIGNSIITETGGGNLGIGTTTPGSKLTVAGAIDTTTNYSIDGTRILANPGTNNLFAGAGAGTDNTSGNGNALIGRNAGNSNTTGDWNSALGTGAGRNNTTGAGNTFVGFQSGLSNTTQNNNTFLGYQANGVAGITNATAIGANASVIQSNSLVLGNNSVNVGIGVTAPSQKLHVAGQIYSSAGGFRFPDGTVQATAATGGGGVTSVTASGPLASSGGTTPNISLTGVVPIVNGGTGSATQNFVDLTMGQTIGGNKTFANAVNTNLQYNINGSRVLANPGADNLFAGVGAGAANTAGSRNSFFGANAGAANTTGVNNSFFGRHVGISNTTGVNNSFFGRDVGISNTTGDGNSFFGGGAGYNNTVGFFNSFFGANAGAANTTGTENSFFGAQAGLSNTTGPYNSFFGIGSGQANTTGHNNSFFGGGTGYNNNTGYNNSFFGRQAGIFNTTGHSNSFFGRDAGSNNTTGAGNTFVGYIAGLSNTTEDNNTFIGYQANGTVGITNATAIGANASVTQSNSFVLGTANVNIGIGVTAPAAKLDIRSGDVYLGSAGQGVILKSPDGATCRKLTIDNAGALVLTPIVCP